ncbi:MAG TPA: CHASE2 domain-containing protein [Dissulfurispiraceae bacterium]
MVEQKTYDFKVRLQRKEVPPPVAIVSIDSESIRNIGRWPWPKAYIALAISRIRDSGAKVIGVDILYPERDLNPGLRELRDIISRIRSYPKLQAHKDLKQVFDGLENVERKLDNDSALASSLVYAKNVMLPMYFTFGSRSPGSHMEEYLVRNSIAASGKDALSAQSVLSPLKEFSTKALGLGHTNHVADQDGIIRSEPLFVSYGERLFPSFALHLAVKYLDRDIQDIVTGGDTIAIGGITAPTYKKNRLLVGFAAANSIPSYSFRDFANGKVPPDALRGRIVLLGCSPQVAGSPLKTPVSQDSSDIMVTANVIGALLNGNCIVRPGWAFPLETGIILLFGTFLALVLPRFGTGTAAVFTSLLLAAWLAVTTYLFLVQGYWLKASYPAILLCIGFAVQHGGRFLWKGEGREEDAPGADVMESNELKLVVGMRTDSGLVRECNEDNYCISKDSGLLAVADGVGGQAFGEVASKMAVEAIRDAIRKGGTEHEFRDFDSEGYSEATNRLGAAVRLANREIYEASRDNPRGQKMGTTIAAVLLRGNRLSIAHVGDSRVYLVRADHIEQLTDDHNLEKPRMRHILTKALGINDDVEPDLTELTLSHGDIVVLCTDGLTTMVPDKEVLSVVKSVKDPRRACALLVRAANENGGKDNVTVIVAYVYKKH